MRGDPAVAGEEMINMNEDRILERLDRLEAMLVVLIDQKMVKDWYTTAEVARLLGKAEFTVREWARLGRVRAEKRQCGRGASQEWIISHEELTRIRNAGLLPQAVNGTGFPSLTSSRLGC
jgi:hypothetical protein